MVTSIDVEELAQQLGPMPRRSAAWRSAVRRRCSVRVAAGLWVLNAALLLAYGLIHLWAAVLRL